MKVIERRNIWFAISLIVFAAGVISFIVQGLTLTLNLPGAQCCKLICIPFLRIRKSWKL